MIRLFPDQEDLVAGLRVAMSQHRRVLAVAPTGFGKTVVLSYMTSRARERGRRIGIFAHRAELLEQISAALRQFKVPHGVIAAGCNPDRRHSVFVCSAQTYARRLAHMPRFDLGIVDEAHHATNGSTWGACMEHSPTAKWIGVTATPERLDGRGLAETFDDMVLGPTVRQLIDAGRLSDYRLFAPNDVSREGIRMLGGDFNKGQAAEAADKPRVTGNVIRHYRQHLNGAPTAAFCVTVAHAEHVAEEFRAAGYRAASLDGKMDTTTRANIVRDFRNGALNVITSAELLSEGFDVPGMYGALLIRPTKSLALYLQQVGRALRKAPGKDKATIIDHVGNSNDDTGHGLPCLERAWSLEGRADAKAKQAVSSARECGKCFARVPISRVSCPECGTVFPRHVRELEQVEGELIEQDIEMRRQVERKPESPAMKAQRQTRTMEGLADLFRRQKQEKLGRPLTPDEAAAAERRAGYVIQARQAKRA